MLKIAEYRILLGVSEQSVSKPTIASSPTVVIADDHPAAVRAVVALLRPYFRVVATVTDGDLALDAVARFEPEVVILDIRMPRLDGLKTARELKTRGFKGAIVLLSVDDNQDYVEAAIDAGAQAYVVKSRMQTDLLRTIDEALARCCVTYW